MRDCAGSAVRRSPRWSWPAAPPPGWAAPTRPAIEFAGRTLLEHALAAVADAAEVVVVGEQVPTSRPVTFVREDPPQGGPAAGLLAGCDALPRPPATLAVLAVDMPRRHRGTVRRLLAAAAGHDGAFLVDADGRRQLAGVLDRARRWTARGPPDPHGLPLHRLLERSTWPTVAAVGDEARDVDTWADLRDLAERRPDRLIRGVRGLRGGLSSANVGSVNLHDWIDELCDVLDIEAEVDEALILDLAGRAPHNVERPAAPVTTYLLGFAAARPATPTRSRSRALAARAQALAEGWDRPADAPDPDDVDDRDPRRQLRRPQHRRVRRLSVPDRSRDACRPRVAPCVPWSPPSPVAPRS